MEKTLRALVCYALAVQMLNSSRSMGSNVLMRIVEQWGLSSIWDSPGEIYPCRLYLRHCLLAAKKLSTEAYENFLDTTYLYDRKTKLRSYVEEKYDLIMNESPPAGLGDRYDG